MDRKLAVILFLLLISAAALTLAAYFFGIFPFDLKVAVYPLGVRKTPQLQPL